jgi:prepilin-type processing-associated H-X9-DG protein
MNTVVASLQGGQQVDVSFTTCRLGTRILDLTYAAITSRSYHPGGLNVSLMDGSVRPVRNSINQMTWRVGWMCIGHELRKRLESQGFWFGPQGSAKRAPSKSVGALGD